MLGNVTRQLRYELTNIQLEYEVIHSQELVWLRKWKEIHVRARHSSQHNLRKKGIRHDHQWENQCSMEVNKGTSFLRANVGGARDSEKTFRAGYLNEV